MCPRFTTLQVGDFDESAAVSESLRLQEGEAADAFDDIDASAACHVGYESASQFSREYSRFFGSAPSRDITRLRNDSLSV